MPRGLANLYEFGTKIPLVIPMPEKFKGGRAVDDFVSLNNLAPTFKSEIIEPERDFMVAAKERHAFVRKGGVGQGGRSIITNKFLYIRNYEPEHWPIGDPLMCGNDDAHVVHYPSPTKVYMLKNQEQEDVEKLFHLAFGKRPDEELYDLLHDPYQMDNVAQIADDEETKKKLAEKLNAFLRRTNDLRMMEGEMAWEETEYFQDRRILLGKITILES